jgi:group I intron endonuclease
VDSIRKKVYPAIKPIAGVYMIINLITSDFYIGSAITGKMAKRFHKHLFRFKGNQLVAAAVMKYGLFCFAFILIEKVPKVITNEEDKELLALEDHYLSTLTPIYNIVSTSSKSVGVKHFDGAKEIARLFYSSERREQFSHGKGAVNKRKKS